GGLGQWLFLLSVVAVFEFWLARLIGLDPDCSAMPMFFTVRLVLATHVTLDDFTTYGAQLFWPLTTAPVAWSSVFIIDPLYSVPLLLAVFAGAIAGFRGRATRWVNAALLLSDRKSTR